MGFEDIQSLPLHSWPSPLVLVIVQVVVTVHEGHELLQIQALRGKKKTNQPLDIQRGKRLLVDSFPVLK